MLSELARRRDYMVTSSTDLSACLVAPRKSRNCAGVSVLGVTSLYRLYGYVKSPLERFIFSLFPKRGQLLKLLTGYKFVPVYPNYKQDEICLYCKYAKPLTT